MSASSDIYTGPLVPAYVRGHLYGLFSLIFGSKPTEQFIGCLKYGEILDVLESFPNISDKAGNLRRLFSEKSVRELNLILGVAYTRLFVTPKTRIVPYESAYSSKDRALLWGPPALDVIGYYAATGYDAPESEPPDHAGVELEFMQYLCEAEQQNNTGNAAQFLEAEKAFYDSHLSTWAPRFFDRIVESRSDLFYCISAEVALQFLDLVSQDYNRLPAGASSCVGT